VDTLTVYVYGAEQICSSCVNLPSSKSTATWLEAALGRKYGDKIKVRYVDIHQPETETESFFCKRVLEEDLWYPVVVIGDEIVAEGNPKLKEICEAIDRLLP
jgi:disulfide oxidoreductase YuzD